MRSPGSWTTRPCVRFLRSFSPTRPPPNPTATQHLPECAAGGSALKHAAVLFVADEYGLGTKRSLQAYMEMAGLNVPEHKAYTGRWCSQGVEPPMPDWSLSTTLEHEG